MALDERLRVAGALIGKGKALVGVGRYDEAVACYGEVVERFGESDEPEIGKQVRIALATTGSVLLRLDRAGEAHAAFDQLRARAASAPNLELASARAEALIAKVLGQAGRDEEAVAVLGELVERYGRVEEPAVRTSVANALVTKGFSLGRMDRSEEALDVYDEVVARYGDAPELQLRESVVGALLNKGARLGRLHRREEELSAYLNYAASWALDVSGVHRTMKAMTKHRPQER